MEKLKVEKIIKSQKTAKISEKAAIVNVHESFQVTSYRIEIISRYSTTIPVSAYESIKLYGTSTTDGIVVKANLISLAEGEPVRVAELQTDTIVIYYLHAMYEKIIFLIKNTKTQHVSFDRTATQVFGTFAAHD